METYPKSQKQQNQDIHLKKIHKSNLSRNEYVYLYYL